MKNISNFIYYRTDSTSLVKNSINNEDALEEKDDLTPLLYRKKAKLFLHDR